MRSLVERLARGEEVAFEQLYDECADRLMRFLTMRLGCRQQAADVLQTTLLRAVKSRRRFAKVEQPVAYLFQIARNEAARQLHKQSRRKTTRSITGDLLWQWIDDPACQREDAEVAVMALSQLTAEDRELVEMKIYAELTFRQIAEITGRPQASVATRYRRALDSMRPWVSKQFGLPIVEESKP
jgi:RNA polymerase sigma-70 factor (ECF subfamily)